MTPVTNMCKICDMKKKSTTLKVKDLISISLYYLMIQKDYRDISVTDICEKANMSRTTFYRHYQNKEDILIEYCDDRFEEFFTKCVFSSSPTSEEFILAMFAYFKKYSRQLFILKKAGQQELLVDQFNSYIRYIISKNKGLNSPFKATNKVSISFLSGGLFNVLMDWVENGLKESPEEMTKDFMKLFERES